MDKKIKLYNIENLPLGTNVTIFVNKTASMKAVSFGNRFGLSSGEFINITDMNDNWEVFLGWI